MLKVKSNPPSKLAQFFYYTVTTILVALIITSIFWQVETDNTYFEYSESHFTSKEGNRDFYVDVNFCSDKVRQFVITRYYFNTEENIYYTLPDAKYRSAGTSCFNTRIHTTTNMLQQGHYEYRVFATYDLNPVRTREQQVATVFVQVE